MCACVRACVCMCVILFMTFSVNKLTGCFLHVYQLAHFFHTGICGIQSSKYLTNTTNMCVYVRLALHSHMIISYNNCLQILVSLFLLYRSNY